MVSYARFGDSFPLFPQNEIQVPIMNITVEISMYPFKEDYKTPINQFIEKLNNFADLEVSTGATSTIICGEYEHVMRVLTEILAWSYENYGKAVYVTKFIPGYTAE